jgi:hypothetical protein
VLFIEFYYLLKKKKKKKKEGFEEGCSAQREREREEKGIYIDCRSKGFQVTGIEPGANRRIYRSGGGSISLCLCACR